MIGIRALQYPWRLAKHLRPGPPGHPLESRVYVYDRGTRSIEIGGRNQYAFRGSLEDGSRIEADICFGLWQRTSLYHSTCGLSGGPVGCSALSLTSSHSRVDPAGPVRSEQARRYHKPLSPGCGQCPGASLHPASERGPPLSCAIRQPSHKTSRPLSSRLSPVRSPPPCSPHSRFATRQELRPPDAIGRDNALPRSRRRCSRKPLGRASSRPAQRLAARRQPDGWLFAVCPGSTRFSVLEVHCYGVLRIRRHRPKFSDTSSNNNVRPCEEHVWQHVR